MDARQLPTDLTTVAATPDFTWIAADDYCDGESAGNGSRPSREVQDRWLKRTVGPILASPAWRTQRSLLIITWDEAGVTGADHRTGQPGGHAAGRLAGHGATRPRQPGSVRPLFDGADHRGGATPGPFTANDEYAVPVNDAFTGRAR